ncbi:hypothetical protein [Burkholderia pyrrocinia]|uniref:hypothetical protein n=1 Tax=Burkholderia pyrrocinia TaxID=60550 RepID=UPI0010466B29|nr:hypothetical protein [Burkholderia pyrrocinia]TDA43627.1 hypothetical protein EVG18_30925 [Burkholderia pyrrocinia]
MLLEVKDDVDVPVSDGDIVFIRGGEVFSVAARGQINENPVLRKPVSFSLNDAPAPAPTHEPHAKYLGEQLKRIAGAGEEDDLWCDLDDLADVRLENGQRIVVQGKDHFFTVHRDDHRYDVTVLVDGETQERRFPSRITVRQAIRRCLPRADRDNVGAFQMVDTNLGTNPLQMEQTLHDAGVRDGHLLSITKKDGGGGAK